MSNTYLESLIDSNIALLEQIQRLLVSLPIDRYVKNQSPSFESSLGKHVRHVIDHYLCFRNGFKTGVVDYDQRSRDCQLELDRDCAVSVAKDINSFLLSLKQNKQADKAINVLLMNDAIGPIGGSSKSSLGRELLFLQGHCVHHFALIAVMLRLTGDKVEKDFGVAPSTLNYQNAVKETA